MPAETAKTTRGSLLVVGGREARHGEGGILDAFVGLCGGPAARLVVLSTASSHPEEKRKEYGEAFSALGVDDVAFFHPEQRAEAENPALLAAVERADGVFLTGGSQLKLVTTLGGTRLESRLRERHRAGLHVGGTSAGAAALSSVMIARGRARSPRLGAVRLSPGLGLLSGIIVDQHFRERDRFGRLLTAVLCNPALLGFGVDENTAFVLPPDGRVRVVGEGTVTIVDGSDLIGTDLEVLDEDEPAAFAGMRLHALRAGWGFDLAERACRVPPPDPAARVAQLAQRRRRRAQESRG